MDESELRALLSPEGLRLLDEVEAGRRAGGPAGNAVAEVAALRRAGHPPELVSAVLTQARLREKAAAKFGDFAGRMLFTSDGLEQASRLAVAAQHAGRFRAAGLTRVADLGCGIGGDAMALAGLGLGVLAVERDPVTAAIASFNLAPFPDAEVRCADAESVSLDGAGLDGVDGGSVDGVWLDPARRSGGRRLSDPADWSPSLDFAFGLELPTGVKLAPGLDRELIPGDAEAQWVSVGREVVELAVWTGALARPGIRRSALVLGEHGAAELTAPGPTPDAEVGPLGEWLYEPDGAVIRAQLIGELAASLGGRMLDPTIAWITSDSALDTPFAQRFRVLGSGTVDRKRLRRLLADRGIGELEIKVRGLDLDPAEFRRALALRGSASATLVLTRLTGRRTAILAQRG